MSQKWSKSGSLGQNSHYLISGPGVACWCGNRRTLLTEDTVDVVLLDRTDFGKSTVVER